MSVNLSFFAGAGWQFFDDSGVPLAGGLIYTYAAGTTTPAVTYTSNSGITAHPNPIILNAAGRIPTGEVWIDSSLNYKFIVNTSTNVLVASYDNIYAGAKAADIVNLQNCTDPAKGDALVAFRQSNENGNLPNTVCGTVHTKLQELVSIKDFGAVGDGVTDDTVAIQNAIDACVGSTLYIPPTSSFYKVTDTLVGVSNIEIVGSGTTGLIKNTNAATDTDVNIFSFTDCSNFKLTNLGLYGMNKPESSPPQNGTDGGGIYIANATNFVIQDCNIQNMTNSGIYVVALPGKTTTQGLIKNNYLNGNGETTTTADYTTAASIDILVVANGTGICHQILIEGNICISPNIVGIGTSFYQNPNTDGSVYDININANLIANKAKHGIMFYGGTLDTQFAYSCLVSNNIIRDCGWIGIYLASGCKDISIVGNRIVNVCTNVPNISLSYAAIGGISNTSDVTGAGRGSHINVIGNTITGFNGWSGIRFFNYNYVSIVGNSIKGDGTAANTTINSAYTYANNPITLQACTNAKVSDNSIQCISPAECGRGAIYNGYIAGTVFYYFGNIVSKNTIYNGANGIYNEYQEGLNCSNNFVRLCTNQSILLSNVNRGIVSENIIESNTTTNVPCIRLSPAATTSVINNTMYGTQANGYGVNVESGCYYVVVEGNNMAQLGTVSNSSKLTDNGTGTQKFNNKFNNDPLIDSFTMAAAATTTILNSSASSPTRIIIWPINAAGATLMGSNKSLYVSSVVSGTSFTVSTASGAAATGSELFGYQLVL